MKAGRIHKNRIWNLAAVILLTGLFLLAAPLTVSALTDAEGGEATTAEELNQVLGGVHQVSGNTLTLQDDVNLKNTVRIIGAKDLTINASKKTVTYDKDVDKGPFNTFEELIASGSYASHILEDFTTPIFYFSNSKVTLSGDGTFHATGKMGSILFIDDKTDITIDNGSFEAKDGVPVIRGLSEKNIRSKVCINGGTFNGKNTDPNIDDEIAVLVGDGGPIDLTVNQGTIGPIHMTTPFYYSYNERYYYSNHNLVINGGTMAAVTCESTATTMKGGTVERTFDNDYTSEVILSGGIIKGNGLSLTRGSTLNMKGGTISASDTEAIKVESPGRGKDSSVTLSGGTITTSKKGARGISASAYADVKVTGGVIRSTSTESSSAGIYASGKNVKVTLQGTSGRPAYVKGYKYSTYKKGPAVLSVGKNTKVFTPKGSKSSYTGGQKLPKSVKGDMSVKYKK